MGARSGLVTADADSVRATAAEQTTFYSTAAA
jgi:hypothetical protein